MAREQGVSVSRQAAKILEQYYQDVSQRRQDVPLLTKKDLDRAERHISGTFENLDDLIRHVNENAIRPKNDASL